MSALWVPLYRLGRFSTSRRPAAATSARHRRTRGSLSAALTVRARPDRLNYARGPIMSVCRAGPGKDRRYPPPTRPPNGRKAPNRAAASSSFVMGRSRVAGVTGSSGCGKNPWGGPVRRGQKVRQKGKWKGPRAKGVTHDSRGMTMAHAAPHESGDPTAAGPGAGWFDEEADARRAPLDGPTLTRAGRSREAGRRKGPPAPARDFRTGRRRTRHDDARHRRVEVLTGCAGSRAEKVPVFPGPPRDSVADRITGTYRGRRRTTSPSRSAWKRWWPVGAPDAPDWANSPMRTESKWWSGRPEGAWTEDSPRGAASRQRSLTPLGTRDRGSSCCAT